MKVSYVDSPREENPLSTSSLGTWPPIIK